MTSMRTYTIDDDSTEELDDAISLELKGSESIIWIHIADPSSSIPVGSALDEQALKKASRVYLVRGVEPMLPIELVRDIFSLEPGRVGKGNRRHSHSL